MKVVRWWLALMLVGVLAVFACTQVEKQTQVTTQMQTTAQNKEEKPTHSGVGLATGEPGMNTYPASGPGETAVLDRPYETAPPLIPHSIKGLTIRRAANDCLDCHLEGVDLGDGHVATKVPASHFVNEYTGAEAKNGVTGIRYLCLQCHVPQAEAEFPVNRYKQAPRMNAR
jgi:nitrate reductase cytochrome c-type subunit